MFGQGSWAVLPETRSSCWSELLGSRGASDPFHEPADRHLIEHRSAMLKAYGQDYEHVVRFLLDKVEVFGVQECMQTCRAAKYRRQTARAAHTGPSTHGSPKSGPNICARSADTCGSMWLMKFIVHLSGKGGCGWHVANDEL
jgi:hypothetical protein